MGRPTLVGRPFFITMEHPHEPINVILKWQEWYRKNQQVASLYQPLETKDSRENLHDTTNAMKTISSILENTTKSKITEYFADTITEAMCEMSGADVYKCFLAAAQEQLTYAEKEYQKAKQLVNYLTGKQ